jgi:aminoglycoside 6'-N-acetyltransferase I
MIKKADLTDANVITTLALLLWPDHEFADLEQEFIEQISSKTNVVFLYIQDLLPVGFAHCSLRFDYVEGTESSPVGFLEGIFVLEEYRHSGFGRALLIACENWTKEQGCTEFASDCELSNQDSLQFHLQVGFKEVNRIICFTKRL